MQKLLILISCLLVTVLAGAQEKSTESARKDTIPFILTPQNNLSIMAVLNQVDTLNLMFHTGAGGVALIESVTEKLPSWQAGGTEKVKSWGGETTADWSEKNSLQIGDLSWENVFITEDKYSGTGTDGKFGPNLFKEKLVEINFDKNVLVIHSALPKVEEGFEKMGLTFYRSSMFLEGIIKLDGKVLKNHFMIHSGYSGTVLFDDEFVAEHGLGQVLKTLSERELKDAYGNILKTKKSLLPSLDFGKNNFSGIPVGMFEGAIGRQKMSVMGGELIKRFNWIFDMGNDLVFIKSNKLMALPFSDV
ncbi:MAG: hypothetical protein AAFZ15_07605 [Bacteroidota bacterium]